MNTSRLTKTILSFLFTIIFGLAHSIAQGKAWSISPTLIISTAADSLLKATVNYEIQPLVSSDDPTRYVINKLDYLKAVRYSLFERKADKLLHLYQIPGIKTKYPIPKQAN